jgi:hypothetical protein
MYLLLNTFQYFHSSLAKLSNFCVLDVQTGGFTNILSVWEVKQQCRKHKKKKRMSDNFASILFLEKIALDLTLVLALTSSSFLICFDWLKKPNGCANQDFTKLLCISFQRERCNNHVYYLRTIIDFCNIKRQQQYKQINQLKINFIMIFVIKFSSKPYRSFLNNSN